MSAPRAVLLRLYPRTWRQRYEAEVLDLLESRPIRWRDRLDLARGALDAWLHPAQPSTAPAVAALAGGGAWLGAALVLAGQPVPPDWPGYLVEMVPFALVGTSFLLVAVVGCALRLGDGADRFGRLALAAAVLGQVAWLVALLLLAAGLDYGATTALASTAAGFGTVLVGLALLRAGDWPVAGLVAAAPVCLLAPAGWAWLGYGAAWSAIGAIGLRSRWRPTLGRP